MGLLRRALTPLVAGAVLAVLPPATAVAAPAWCPPGADVTCSTVTVPLDRSGAVPGTVTLPVARAAAKGVSKGAIAVLTGGPGQASLPLFDDLREVLAPLLGDHDLLVFDARGTGAAGALQCSSDTAAGCAQELGPARSLYTAREAVADLEAVRATLGIDRLSLFAVSYGTRVARAYAATYPSHVDRLVLDSTVPAEGPDPFMRSTLQALPRVLRAICARGVCRHVTPSVTRDFRRLAARLDRGPLRGYYVDARGARHHVKVVGSDLLDLLLASDLDPLLRGQLPAALHSAAGGDLALLLRLLGSPNPDGGSSPQEMSDALFAATTCEETQFPWARTASTDQRLQALTGALRAIGAAAFRPFDVHTVVLDSPLSMCADWPVAPVAPAVPTGPLSGVPTLILSGQEDVRTPLEDAQRVAANIAGASVVTVADTGHSVLGTAPTDCPLRQVVRFFAGQPTQSCLSRENAAVAPLAPAALSRVSPLRGTHGAAGRVLGAVRATVDDAISSYAVGALEGAGPVQRLPGLRAGSYRVTPSAVDLRRAEYVPRVVVDGTLHATAAGALVGSLKVRAPRGLSGVVTLQRGGGVRARLGHQVLRAHASAVAASIARARHAVPLRPLRLRIR